MLSTKNIPATTTSKAKNLSPGNQLCKVNSVALEQGYNLGSYKLILNLEGPDLGPDFEGFLVDVNNPNGPRYAGQVGKVRFYQYQYEDKPSLKISRDTSILTSLKHLAAALGKEEMLDSISAKTIEEFVASANNVLSGPTFINFCIGGKEYKDKNGYTKHDLFIPAYKNGEAGLAGINSKIKLATFNEATHIVKMKEAAPVEAFEPAVDDFDL